MKESLSKRVVRGNIIENWETKDEPVHLGTIRNRLTTQQRESSINRLLGLYENILEQGEIEADGSSEQMELRLTGAVVQQEGKLRVYNRIYQEVFNLEWVKEELNKLRPYAESLNAWLKSVKQDESRLLQGEALGEALTWRRGKRLSPEDDEFLDASQKVALKTEQEGNKILREAERKAKRLIKIGTGILVAFLSASGIIGLISYQTQKETQLRLDATEIQVEAAEAEQDNTIKLWDVATGKEKATLTGHRYVVYTISYSPNGKTIASDSADNTIILWSLDLDQLMAKGCNWIKDYLNTHSEETELREICRQVGKARE